MENEGFFLVGRLVGPARLNAKGTYANAYVLVGNSQQPHKLNGKADVMNPLLTAEFGTLVTVVLWAPRVDKFDAERVELSVKELVEVKLPAHA